MNSHILSIVMAASAQYPIMSSSMPFGKVQEPNHEQPTDQQTSNGQQQNTGCKAPQSVLNFLRSHAAHPTTPSGGDGNDPNRPSDLTQLNGEDLNPDEEMKRKILALLEKLRAVVVTVPRNHREAGLVHARFGDHAAAAVGQAELRIRNNGLACIAFDLEAGAHIRAGNPAAAAVAEQNQRRAEDVVRRIYAAQKAREKAKDQK